MRPIIPKIAPWVIYVIREIDGTTPVCCKIGITSRGVHSRLPNLQMGNPRPLVLVHQFGVQTRMEARHIEGTVHRRLIEQKIRYEWFRIGPEEAMQAVERVLSDFGIGTVSVLQQNLFEEQG